MRASGGHRVKALAVERTEGGGVVDVKHEQAV